MTSPKSPYKESGVSINKILGSSEADNKSRKKEKSLEQKIEEILRHYWIDQYNKNAYVKNCVKAVIKIINENSSI